MSIDALIAVGKHWSSFSRSLMSHKEFTSASEFILTIVSDLDAKPDQIYASDEVGVAIRFITSNEWESWKLFHPGNLTPDKACSYLIYMLGESKNRIRFAELLSSYYGRQKIQKHVDSCGTCGVTAVMRT